jgi:hypothetical protein
LLAIVPSSTLKGFELEVPPLLLDEFDTNKLPLTVERTIRAGPTTANAPA